MAARRSRVARIVPNLWFDTRAEEAAGFYCSIFKNSPVVRVLHYTEAGPGPVGEEGPCGWLKVGSAVVAGHSRRNGRRVRRRGPRCAARATQAMFGMRKLDIAAMRQAADGSPVS